MSNADPVHDEWFPRPHEDDARTAEALAPPLSSEPALRPDALCLQRWMDLSA